MDKDTEKDLKKILKHTEYRLFHDGNGYVMTNKGDVDDSAEKTFRFRTLNRLIGMVYKEAFGN